MNYVLSDDTWVKDEIEVAHHVIDSRSYTMGEYVNRFEEMFADKFGSKFAVMCNSGSSANLLMVSALVYSGILRRGDEVIVTAVSWSTTYFPLSQYGLKIRFVDIDKYTLNLDIQLLEEAITQNTKAVLAVNLLGNPNDFQYLKQICRNYNLILLEDNCESMGAIFDNQYTGTFGLLGTFSTYFSHHISTIEGGVVLTDDEELYHYMLAIRSHGWTRNIPKESCIYKKNEDKFYESFNFIMPGYNLRPIEIEAAVGLQQLEKLDKFIGQRRKNAELFQKNMENRKGYRMQKEIGKSSWFGFAVILQGANVGKRDAYIKRLQENKIEVRPIVAGNFLKQKAIKYMEHSVYQTLKNADEIHDNGFFVGNHSKFMKDEIELLLNTFEKAEKNE